VGTRFQTEAVHVLTVSSGDVSDHYRCNLAEEAVQGRIGSADVWLRDKRVALEPGDNTYFPEGVKRQIRATENALSSAILVTQISPPQIDIYVKHVFYNAELGVVNREAVSKAALNAPRVNLYTTPLAYRESFSAERAWNLPQDDVRSNGALFNFCKGAPFSGIGRTLCWERMGYGRNE
jgi:mannose-6-phosphate isomerase-like protein (cupin superfamily)